MPVNFKDPISVEGMNLTHVDVEAPPLGDSGEVQIAVGQEEPPLYIEDEGEVSALVSLWAALNFIPDGSDEPVAHVWATAEGTFSIAADACKDLTDAKLQLREKGTLLVYEFLRSQTGYLCNAAGLSPVSMPVVDVKRFIEAVGEE